MNYSCIINKTWIFLAYACLRVVEQMIISLAMTSYFLKYNVVVYLSLCGEC